MSRLQSLSVAELDAFLQPAKLLRRAHCCESPLPTPIVLLLACDCIALSSPPTHPLRAPSDQDRDALPGPGALLSFGNSDGRAYMLYKLETFQNHYALQI
jgi:hypothetical protein